METTLLKLFEGLSIYQTLSFIGMCFMLRFLYEIKIALVKSKAWQENHEQMDNMRFTALGVREEQHG